MVERIPVTRVVSTPEALDGAAVPPGTIVLRIAPDEAIVLGETQVEVADPHAIVFADSGWAGVWLDSTSAAAFLLAECEWELPSARPAFAQGMVSHLAAKLWLEEDRTLILVPSAMRAELEARLAH